MDHIQQPYTLQEIRDRIASNDYGAEMMLQHLLLRAAELESERDTLRAERDLFQSAIRAWVNTPSHHDCGACDAIESILSK